MPLTITGSVSNPRAFGRLVAQSSGRVVAGKLRAQAELARRLAEQYADSDLGPSRSGNRRRDKGVSYRKGFDAPLYTGLDDFSSGLMQITLRNRSRHARVLEVGAGAHDIPVGDKGVLAWPIPYAKPGPIAVATRRTVKHKGFAGYLILERAARDAMAQGFAGGSLGHARIDVIST